MKNLLFFSLINLLQLFAYTQNAGFSFVNQTGGASPDRGTSVITDASGNIYNTGFFAGSMDLDPSAGTQMTTSNGSYDFFIQKLNASGNLIWALSIGGTGPELVSSIALDAAGNVYMAGSFQATVDFDPGVGISNLTAIASNDAFLLKLDASGNFVWVNQIECSGSISITTIAIDGSDNIISTGYFSYDADLDPGSGIDPYTATAPYDCFLQKVNSAGGFLWGKRFASDGTGSPSSYGYTLEVDDLNNVYVAGGFKGTIDFNPNTMIDNSLTSNGDQDIFIEKLNQNGELVWVKQIGGTGNDRAMSIDVDASSNIYCRTNFSGTVDFDPAIMSASNLTAQASVDIALLKLDSDGDFTWVLQLGGFQAGPTSFSVVVDSQGDSYVTGWFTGSDNFDVEADNNTLVSAGGYDIFLQKIDANGDFLWAIQMGGTSNDAVNSLALTPSGNILLSGFFMGTSDFDPEAGIQNLTSNGVTDGFLLELSIAGALPIELSSFNAYTEDLSVRLNWSTTSETNNDYFIIERSNDGENWEDASMKNGAGNSSTTLNYTDIDSNPYSGQSFYRLQQVDFDGTFTYSDVVVITIPLHELSVYPNPTINNVTLDFGTEIIGATISVRNSLGQEIFSIQNYEEIKIELELPEEKGLYLIDVQAEDAIASYKVVKQ